MTEENEAQVFACLERYLASELVARASVKSPNNWLHDCARDNWNSKWPPAVKSNNGSAKQKQIASVFDELEAEFTRKQ